MKINQFAQDNKYFLGARSRMCYITDVNRTLHVVDVCKFWVKFWFNRQPQRRWQVQLNYVSLHFTLLIN